MNGRNKLFQYKPHVRKMFQLIPEMRMFASVGMHGSKGFGSSVTS